MFNALKGAVGASGAAAFPEEAIVNAVLFDGADWLTKADGIGGSAADNKFALGSFWVKKNGDGVLQTPMSSDIDSGGSGRTRIEIQPTNIFAIKFNHASGEAVNATSTETITDDGNWHHIMYSFDLSDTGKRHALLDDVPMTMTWGVYNGDSNIPYSVTDVSDTWTVGSRTVAGVWQFDSDVAQFYFTNEYLDLSVEANRRKLISENGKPVEQGSNGSLVTGTPPLIYLNGATGTWHENDGAGGDFVEVGTLTTASSSPSD